MNYRIIEILNDVERMDLTKEQKNIVKELLNSKGFRDIYERRRKSKRTFYRDLKRIEEAFDEYNRD